MWNMPVLFKNVPDLLKTKYTHIHTPLSGRFIDAAILSLSPWCNGLPSHLGYCSAAAVKSGTVRGRTHTHTYFYLYEDTD